MDWAGVMFPASILTFAATLLDQARTHGLHIVTAESCTGGLIAGALTEISGSSDVVDRGFVVYTNRAKTELLGVTPELIREFGAVSEEVARAMAEGALRHSAAQLAISCTGIAGPSGATPSKPIGLVHFVAACPGQTTLHLECRFGAIGRGNVRMRSVEEALKLLLRII
jgi:nicotinamide-nucleotide amidase